jgi:hypothetical protein
MPGDYEQCESTVLEYIRSIKGQCIVVKELGKKGNHPHLNVVYDDPLKNINHVPRKWRNKFPKDIVERNPKLLKCKKVTNMSQLIEGYLQKEGESCTVLYKRGKFTNKKSKVREYIDELLADKSLWINHTCDNPDFKSIEYLLKKFCRVCQKEEATASGGPVKTVMNGA